MTIGSKFIIAVPICENLDETWRVIDSYLELEPGGFMVGVGGKLPVLSPPGRRDLVDYGMLSRFISDLKRRAPQAFVAVDAEGGSIFNILEGTSPLKSTRSYAGFRSDTRLTVELAEHLTSHAELLAGIGVDINFAPLLDVPLPGYLGYAAEDNRCVSDDPGEIYDFAELFIETHRKQGVLCTAKHFPGYGHLNTNPHTRLSAEAAGWNADLALAPYRRLIRENQLDALMLGHCTTPLHPGIPATLAPAALNLLRDELGFNGIAVADELFMGAVNDYYRSDSSGRSDGDPEGEQRAVDAWELCDLIIVSYPIQNRDGTVSGIPGGERRLPRMISAVKAALEDGRITSGSLELSGERLRRAGLLK